MTPNFIAGDQDAAVLSSSPLFRTRFSRNSIHVHMLMLYVAEIVRRTLMCPGHRGSLCVLAVFMYAPFAWNVGPVHVLCAARLGSVNFLSADDKACSSILCYNSFISCLPDAQYLGQCTALRRWVQRARQYHSCLRH